MEGDYSASAATDVLEWSFSIMRKVDTSSNFFESKTALRFNNTKKIAPQDDFENFTTKLLTRTENCAII